MPISIPPTNITPETAFVLNGQLPLDGTIDLSGLVNPQKVWFKYTLGENDFALVVFSSGQDFAAPATGFRPHWTFRFNDPLAAPYQESTGFYTVEGFIEESPGIPKVGDIYISLENGYLGSFAPTGPINVWIKKASNLEVPIGSLLVNNDISPFPLTVVSPTGIPTQVRSFPSGESAFILTNGISLWSDADDNTLLFRYGSDLVQLNTLNWPRGHLRAPISGNRTDTFYIANRVTTVNGGRITTVSSAGVLGPTEWQILNAIGSYSQFYHVAPSFVDNDIIYVNVSIFPAIPGITTYGICKFHKSTQLIDTEFISPDSAYSWAGFYGEEFLVLPTDNILVMYNDGPSGSIVRMYDASGTTIRDFVINDADVNRIAYGTDYTTFWAWSFSWEDFDSRFIEFRISDGAILHDFTLISTTSGVGFSSAPDDFTDELFGVPESCPFLVTMSVLPPYGPPVIIPPPVPNDPSGLYVAVPPNNNPPPPTHDTYIDRTVTPTASIIKKIPNPTIRTGLFGE